MSVWEQALIALLIVAVILFLGPGAKKSLEESQKAENPDWQGAIIPLAMVIMFVILLIAMAKR